MRIQTVGVCSKESGMESSSIFIGEPSQKNTNGLWEDAFKPLTAKNGLPRQRRP